MMMSLKLCAVDKDPGPNSFTMKFFIKFWEAVKQDIMNAFQIIYDKEMFEKSFNVTFIALIPKRKGANELRNCRPISLIGCIYKIFSQIITERLKGVMEKLVDSQQMAFIQRKIMDVVLVANEAVRSGLKQKKQGILHKLT